MFHNFEPLAQHDPALTASLEQMVQRAGQDIPPDRMFWMDAAEKTTELNAYVTGLGASKRIVVWNTTISKIPRHKSFSSLATKWATTSCSTSGRASRSRSLRCW